MHKPTPLHSWNLNTTEAANVQRELADKVQFGLVEHQPRLIAGVDCAFPHAGKDCLAAALVWDMQAKCVVEERHALVPVQFPYIPGFLSFREAPAIIQALEMLQHQVDLLMFDGHGIAHPRRLGIASHVALWFDMPAVACAKSRLTGKYTEPGLQRASQSDLVANNNELLGRVVRTRDKVRPVFVSVGHKTTLEQAVDLVLECGGGYRLPEPTRLADKRVAEIKKNLS